MGVLLCVRCEINISHCQQSYLLSVICVPSLSIVLPLLHTHTHKTQELHRDWLRLPVSPWHQGIYNAETRLFPSFSLRNETWIAIKVRTCTKVTDVWIPSVTCCLNVTSTVVATECNPRPREEQWFQDNFSQQNLLAGVILHDLGWQHYLI